MRSDKIHLAISHGNNRFEICNMVAKGIRATHQAGMRTEESIDRVLGLIGPKFIGPRQIQVYFPRPRRWPERSTKTQPAEVVCGSPAN